jgi:hypothetical protein
LRLVSPHSTWVELMTERVATSRKGQRSTRPCIGGEQEWLAVDLAARGWQLCYVSELMVHHHPSPHRDGSRRRWQLLRNALWFAWLRRPV